ncbi:transmembrane and coiled-coil domain-containing protein 1-like protein [Tritrichomonas foetus]|uniref:Transmembrane and coiled-coil domain-containing protein 1-like protein n=1 Tax=Tritrichomonas foetus TaxID=1144522 RepID=A0A1J4L087_9EUKA|nr:transmembrane and coiled-coil domain-containing protein 1-like protein [Tritrichomonas foetus]|eukprot:OHT16826.1 transmembrane and coiled-coil domain-containing protein 1-like protein [Tritrichomonas foetus]
MARKSYLLSNFWLIPKKKNSLEMKTIFYGLSVLSISFLVSSIKAFINWFFILRNPNFKLQSSQLEKKKQQLQELEEQSNDDKATQKKVKRLKNDIKAHSQAISQLSMKYQIISQISLFVIGRILNSNFRGIVCTKLPFEPFSILTRMVHSGIENEDFTDANFYFVYFLSTTLFGDFLNKFFGLEQVNLDFTSMMQMNMPQT